MNTLEFPRGTTKEVRAAAKYLQKMLSRPEIVQGLIGLRCEIFDVHQRRWLASLGEHYGKTLSEASEQESTPGLSQNPVGEEESDDGDTARPKRQIRIGGSGSKSIIPVQQGVPAPAMMRLTKDLHIGTALQQFLVDVNGDPEAFFNQDKIGKIQVHLGRFTSPTEVGSAFFACYQYTKQLERRNEIDQVRWAFQLVTMFDLVLVIFPNATGRRLSEDMRREFDAKVGQVFRENDTRLDVAFSDVALWSRLGLKLDQLCREFGEGCLLYLGRHLSRDFLEYKYRENSEVNQAVFTQLRGLGLQEMADASGANRLGRNVRAYMIRMFQGYIQC